MVPSGPTPDPVPAEYARPALMRGLEIEALTGVNPYKFGLIGSTDSDTGLPTASETNFAGKGQKNSRPESRSKPTGIGSSRGWDMGAAGLVAVWAPKFVVQALKDPDGANLDRVQIVKAWANGGGKVHEQVFDVAWSDDREQLPNGSLSPVGNTVDLATGEYTNTIAAAELNATWSDPSFDPAESALYYARVREIPTPRYSLLDAIALGASVNKTDHLATLQKRAYSSPIWYSPQPK